MSVLFVSFSFIHFKDSKRSQILVLVERVMFYFLLMSWNIIKIFTNRSWFQSAPHACVITRPARWAKSNHFIPSSPSWMISCHRCILSLFECKVYGCIMPKEEATDHDQTLYNCAKLKTIQNAGHVLIWRSPYDIHKSFAICKFSFQIIFINFANCRSGSFLANCCSWLYLQIVALSLFWQVSHIVNTNVCCELCKLSFQFPIVFQDDLLQITVQDHLFFFKICKVISRDGQNSTLSENAWFVWLKSMTSWQLEEMRHLLWWTLKDSATQQQQLDLWKAKFCNMGIC